MLDEINDVNSRYETRLGDQERFHERLQKVQSDLNGVQMSLTQKMYSIQGYLTKRVEMEDLIDKLKRLEEKAKKTFCKINVDAEYLFTCIPGAAKSKGGDDVCKPFDLDG